MSLPRLPKEQIKYKNKWANATLRPFTIGEQKLMLQYKDSKNPTDIFRALKQLLETCSKGVDVGKLPLFVIEDMFLKIRQKSIGETVDLGYVCKEEGDAGTCNNKIKVTVDLEKFKIVEPEGYTNKIMLTDSIGIVLKELSLDEMIDKESFDEVDFIANSIECVFDGDEVTQASDVSKDELKSFYEDLTSIQKQKIQEAFMDKKPYVHYHTEVTCSKCGSRHDIDFTSVAELFL